MKMVRELPYIESWVGFVSVNETLSHTFFSRKKTPQPNTKAFCYTHF